MKKVISLLLVAAMLVSTLVGCGKKEASGLTIVDGKLSIGMEVGYPPFEYYLEDGVTPTGFDVRLGTALSEKLGMEVEFVDTAWDGILTGLDTDKYDVVISALSYTEERAAKYEFTAPYIGNAQAMVIKKDSGVTATVPEECAGLGVAYQAETVSDIYMTSLLDGGMEFTPFEYDKVMNCFDDLASGRCDVVICDKLVATDYVAGEDSEFELVWTGETNETFAIAAKQGNTELVAALDEALAELFADGTMVEISNEFFGMDVVSDLTETE